jgi:predicted DsbA family dithiol-disulfide isomerase
MNTVRIDIWSDFVCPFCYLAEPALERVAAEFPGVAIAWRAFELRPDPVPTLDPQGTYLRDVWARAVYPMAHERGMKLTLPPVQPRSRLAHEAAAHAASLGRGPAMIHEIFRAFFERGADIGQIGTLAQAAAAAGVGADDLRTALAEGRHRAQVLADEEQAAELGLSAVPAIVVGGAERDCAPGVLISGAQPYEIIARAVREVAAHG